MLSVDTVNFYTRWREKAENSAQLGDLSGAFDAYFSYFVVYNKLYAEATFELARKGLVPLPVDRFPDSNAAKEYVIKFVGAKRFQKLLYSDSKCVEAVDEIKGFIGREEFYIKLHMANGLPQRGEDLNLLEKLNAPGCAEKSGAICDFLYSLRCNMLHGHKGFDPVQERLLLPSITLLRKCCEILYEHLLKA